MFIITVLISLKVTKLKSARIKRLESMPFTNNALNDDQPDKEYQYRAYVVSLALGRTSNAPLSTIQKIRPVEFKDWT